ncbi:hypothetical protein IQ37_15590 [Chryseobacterium piperi]|uniref:HTH tetR-type domain-containing protein n=1 Tax=Chryseobacterium piperi TaxID=558152 RepID=A0A086AVG1_9FLAO|nr:TetR/AcrR family transcriptional regulator [Chryseobacterium piperi]ASW73738.1 TetR/AcrR family transcriptional regulator [Chryseobacterium piperi]KFF20675.1 hypothetical protein IQ37_15590 [Chryseobacterium piperi]
MSKKNTKDYILTEAMQILKNEGSCGVSMRKVACACDISLSNLQYHYTNKTILFQELTAQFFKQCEENLLKEWEILSSDKSLSTEEFISKLLIILLEDDENGIDYYLYREIWALSLRDPELADSVNTFYRRYVELIAKLVGQVKQSSPEKVASLLVSFQEGYSIVRNAMPLDFKKTIEMLTKIIINL